jgi:hypothetical protein
MAFVVQITNTDDLVSYLIPDGVKAFRDRGLEIPESEVCL